MIRIKTFSGILLISLAEACFAQNKTYQVMAIGFYNCENFFDTIHDPGKKDEEFTPHGNYHYTQKVYREKLHNIATVIQQMGTDVTPDGAAIVGFAEIENDNVLNDLIKEPEILKRNYHYLWFYGPDERGISTAMLYNPQYFKVLNAVPVKIDVVSIGWDRPTRDILLVNGILSGDTVHVLVNHWPSKYGGETETIPGRMLAASVDKKIIDSLLNINPYSKILILGDFNDNPTSPGIIKVLQAKEEKSETQLTDIYNPWIKLYKKGYGTENYQGEWNLIDQIMLSGAFLKNENNGWKFYKTEIFKKDFLLNKFGIYKGLPHRSFTINQVWDNGYSDHFPVIVYLTKQIQ